MPDKSSHMRVLYMVPYTPTLIRTRPYNLIRALARRGHQVTLATLWEDEAERQALDEWRARGVNVVATPLSRPRKAWNAVAAWIGRRGTWNLQPETAMPPMPLQAVYCWQPALARRLEHATRDTHYDIIHVEHLRGARYGLHLKSPSPQPPAPIIWDSVDCISYLFEQAARDSRSLLGRWMTRLELPRTRRYEGWLVGQFDRVLITSSVDQAALERLAAASGFSSPGRRGGREGEVTVLPNGVDLTYFCPNDTPRDEATVVFTGKMSYHANVTAALHLVHDIMPLVWAQRPDVQVWIVGKDPPRNVQLTSNVERATRNVQRVTVTGAVPDLRPYLRRATIAAVPTLYGAGIPNKALEAMACGTPVVATPRAVAALAAQPDCELIVAEDAGAFARAILDLLDDAGRRAELGRAGRAYVEAHHDWNCIAAELEAIYVDAIRGRQA